MASDYAFIRAYGKFTGAKESKIDEDVRKARIANAPSNAMSYDEEKKRWIRFTELEDKADEGDAEAKEQIKQIRAIMRAM